MKLLTITLLVLPLFVQSQNKSDTGRIYSSLWGKNGELWNKKKLPDFTQAGYRKNRAPIPDHPVKVNILDFGGKGDGVTDNTRALRSAIQQCGNKGTVYIPAGNYHFRDTIVIRKSGVCIRGAGTSATTLFFEKGLEELYPDYGIHYPKQSGWSWSGAMILFQGKIAESGIEQLTIQFPDKPWAGHTYDEKGYNAIGFSSGANNGWARYIRFVGADMGIWIDSTSHHITAEHWVLDLEPVRASQPLSGHHAINITGSYNLLQHFELKGKYQHDLSVETSGAKYNVFRDGKGKDLAIDHHNHAQTHNLFTNLDAGLGKRLYFSGGISTPRGICFKETYWNITGVNNMNYCDQHNDSTKQSAGNICVGIKTKRASELNNKHHNWFETIPPEKLYPQDLYQAQMKLHGYPMPEDTAKLNVRNDQAFERTEILRIGSDDFGSRPVSSYPVIIRHHQQLISQPADLDKDGLWDLLFIEVHLLPFSADTLLLYWQSKQPGAYKNLTNVRFSLRSTNGVPQPEITDSFRVRGYVQDIGNPVYQLEGPAIENDKVAFRVFFDQRNGKDVYGKCTTGPVLDTIGINGNWHMLQPWGMDILKTGPSLGAGAFAVREAGMNYKLADADSTVFTQLYEGPLAASFRLDFYNWDVGTKKRSGSEIVSMQKGDYFYTSTLHLPLTGEQTLLQGFAHFYHDSLVVMKHNSLYSSISTFGKQAEGTATMLGLAIMVPQRSFLSSGCKDLPNSCYVQMKTKNIINTLFFACWEKTDVRFADKHGFTGYLQQVANRLAHPVQITISKKI